MSVTSDNPLSRFFTRLGDVSSRLVKRYLPDAFIFALLLTLATLVFAVALTEKRPVAIARHWAEGFWFVLSFSMQSSLALITGWALADSPPVKRVLGRIADVPETQTQAVFAPGGEYDACTAIGQRARSGRTDPRRGAGYDGNAAVERALRYRLALSSPAPKGI